MTTFHHALRQGPFRILTGPDVPPMRFKSRPEARDSVQGALPPARRSRRAEGVRRGGRLGPTRKANEPT